MLNILITKRKFKRLFQIFSLILFLDYPVLPLISEFIHKDYSCDEYEVLTCISVTLIFTALIASFWCVFWAMNYVAFYMEKPFDPKHLREKIQDVLSKRTSA